MSKLNSMHSDIPTYSLEDRRNNIILKLSNFRTYGDAEIKIPTNSVTLINGPSGVGKTTILEAFIFIMYNGVTHPERFETKRCWGWLFMGDLAIYRQKDPVLLKVWKSSISPGNPSIKPEEYTQDDAQRVIDSIYGSQDIFFGCSYLRQKEFSVFLNGTDSEKLEIMKAVAMKGTELNELKDPIKTKVAQLAEQTTGIKAQLELTLSNVRVFDQRNPNIVQYQVPENSEDVMKKVRELRELMDSHDKEFEEALRREASANLIKQQIDSIKSAKSNLEQQAARLEFGKLKSRLSEIENKLQEFTGVSFDAEKLAKAQMFKLWTQEVSRLEAKLNEIEKDFQIAGNNIRTILPEFPKYVSPGSALSEFTPEQEAAWKASTEFIESSSAKFEAVSTATAEAGMLLSQIDMKTLDDAKVALKSAEEELTKAQDKEKSVREGLDKYRSANKMKCPSCQAVVIVGADGKHLEKCSDAPSGIGAMLGGSSESKNEEVVMVTHDDLAQAAGQVASITSKKDRLSAIITAVEGKLKFDLGDLTVESALASLPLFKKFTEYKLATDSLRETLQEQIKKKPEEIKEKIADSTEKNMLEAEKTGVMKSMESHGDLLRAIEQQDVSLKQFTQMWTEATNHPGENSLDIKKKKIALQSQIDQLMHLSSATDLIAQRSILEKTMREKAEAAQMCERKTAAAKRLLDKAIEAERISLESAVSEINNYLSTILKRLFTTIPISVSLSTTKVLKSRKNAVSQRFDIKIFYNNSEYGSAKQLSGGEKDRLSLALTLAMSQKFGGSILFLDETLSSLDAELKSEAVTLLKEFAVSRSVIVISHEETEGIYDHVIRIKPKN